MTTRRRAALLLTSLLLAGLSLQADELTYPTARKSNQTDVYHGKTVADPYRWLEDPDSPETRAWVDAEVKLTNAYLDAIPERAAIRRKLTALRNYERYGQPQKHGSRYFFLRNSGLQNQNVLYVTESVQGTPRVLLDPNTLSKDGTVALADISVTHDGKILAYALTEGGSDWLQWHFRDVDTGQDLPDVLEHVKFSSVAWTRDNKSVYYSRYEVASQVTALRDVNASPKLSYHRLGTLQKEDQIVYERPDEPGLLFYSSVTDDGRYLSVTLEKGTTPNNQILVRDLSRPGSELKPLTPAFTAQFFLIGNEGSVFFVRTTDAAPRWRVVAIDAAQPDRPHWNEVIPSGKDSLEAVSYLNRNFIAQYMQDAHSVVRVYDEKGRPVRDLPLPGLGTTMGFLGYQSDKETFYSFSSFAVPLTIYHYDLSSGKSTVWRQAQFPADLSPYVAEQVFYTSKGGTKVPMFLVHCKDWKHDGNNPTLLYGYGGFNISLTPDFSSKWIAWLEMGGVLAVPNLRGGGEYGEEWHQAGTKLHKQNVFDDFIAAAEYLIANKITSPQRLAINGGSNGGLLVGAVMTQRPELFGAAVPEVGVLDMLRFHKFTIGWALGGGLWLGRRCRTVPGALPVFAAAQRQTGCPVSASVHHDRRPRRSRSAGPQFQVCGHAAGKRPEERSAPIDPDSNPCRAWRGKTGRNSN